MRRSRTADRIVLRVDGTRSDAMIIESRGDLAPDARARAGDAGSGGSDSRHVLRSGAVVRAPTACGAAALVDLDPHPCVGTCHGGDIPWRRGAGGRLADVGHRRGRDRRRRARRAPPWRSQRSRGASTHPVWERAVLIAGLAFAEVRHDSACKSLGCRTGPVSHTAPAVGTFHRQDLALTGGQRSPCAVSRGCRGVARSGVILR